MAVRTLFVDTQKPKCIPLITLKCNFSTQKPERTLWTTAGHLSQYSTTSVFWRKLGKTEEHSISSNFCSCTETRGKKKTLTTNLITSKLPQPYKWWAFSHTQTCYVFWHFLRNTLASSLPSSSSAPSLSSILPFWKILVFPVRRPRWLVRKFLLLILLLRTNISWRV